MKNSCRNPGDVNITHRVADILMMSPNQIPMDFPGSSELEAFVSAAGGSCDESKKAYAKLLPAVTRTVTMMDSKEMSDIKVYSYHKTDGLRQ